MLRISSLRLAFTLLLTCCLLPMLSAKVVWLVGKKAPVQADAVAEQLRAMLAPEPVEVVTFDTLVGWSNTPATLGTRRTCVSADTLLVTLSPEESEGFAFLGLLALQAQRPIHLTKTTLVAVQKPVYQMSGLCNNTALQRSARLALGGHLNFIPVPKAWQQVYTDDTFYNEKVAKGAPIENYVTAAAIAYSIKGETIDLPAFPGIHPDVAADIKASVRKGLTLKEDVLYAAKHLPVKAFNVRVGSAFDAILYDGAFERKVGDWLQAIAIADGRKLTLHYTKDTAISTGWPCLFRTSQSLGEMTNVTLYTRPAFADDTAIEELTHLEEILKSDGANPNWLPFQLAVAEWSRRFPDIPVYQGTLPSDATAAMFAAMLYLKWTGAPVLPPSSNQYISSAITVGIDTMLRNQRLYRDVNAVLCRPMGNNRFTFSLWRKPADDVTLRLDTDTKGKRVSDRKLIFTPDNFWSPQSVTVDTPCTFYWKVPARDFPGQNTGARALN